MSETSHAFKTIGLVAKSEDPRLPATLSTISGFLQGDGRNVLADANAARLLDDRVPACELESLSEASDLIIVIGGDGTLLATARAAVDADTPLVGVNLGRLGFLVDISPIDVVRSLDRILSGDYLEEKRFLLTARIGDQDPVFALNDIVFHKWNVARMIEFETWVDGKLVDAQRSDGLIISTPTGSTAYALSGGGPLLAPSLNAIALVPICPHTLSNRPIVVHGSCEIGIVVCGRTKTRNVRVTCDGQSILRVGKDERLVVRKHDRTIRLFHPTDHDHYELLRAKLRWGDRANCDRTG